MSWPEYRYLLSGGLAPIFSQTRHEDWWIDRVAAVLALSVLVVLVSGLLGGWR